MAEYKLIMLSNAQPGRDDEFKKWYEGHLNDMLRIPGVVGAQCYDYDMELSAKPEGAYKYMAIYDISTNDLSHTLTTLQKSAGTSAMPMSDAMNPKTSAVVYKARGQRKVAENR
jgi:hypothetical protein